MYIFIIIFIMSHKVKLIFILRFIGSGQQKGSLVTKIYNNHWQALNIVLLENIPWYLSVYLHTIKITCNEENVIPSKTIYCCFYLIIILLNFLSLFSYAIQLINTFYFNFCLFLF